ncbi:GATA-like domain protein [Schizosaccharomyces osmophilus]|uniref:GATA-like domain protein n=1 Tax=Schizosaccharomyces osmophilus TaxID=2545709 RepID=A0AAF0AW34_9SCHI|nr:GATA-like domain protein [Schizosaccharomyces osmophilus]WBW72665.1 GATA-like domain protein [Schizosaccharomyces osmophilus]
MTKRMLSSNPMLSLETDNIAKLGTLTADNLSCMWNVFTKCAENLENGRRLENLSWRLWYRETVMSESGQSPYERMEASIPDLSSSCGSIASSADSDAGVCTYSPNSKSDTIRLNSSTNFGSQESSVHDNPRGLINSTSSLRPQTRRSNSRLISSDTFSQLITSFSPLEKPLEKSVEKLSKEDSSYAYKKADLHQQPSNPSSKHQDRPALAVTVSEPYFASSSSNLERRKDAYSDRMTPSGPTLQNEEMPKERISKPVPSYRVKLQTVNKSVSDSVAAAARAKNAEREKIAKLTVTPGKTTSVIHGFHPSSAKTTPSPSTKTKTALQDSNAGFGTLKQPPIINKSHPFFYLRGAYSVKNNSQSSSMISTTDDETNPPKFCVDPKLKTRNADESRNVSSVSDDEDAWVSVDEETNTPPCFYKRPPTPFSSYRNSALSLLLSKEDRARNGHNDDSKSRVPTASPVIHFNKDNTDAHEAKMDASNSSLLSDSIPQSSEPRVYQISHNNANRTKLLNSEIPESLRRDLLWERRQKASLNSAVLRRHFKKNQSEDEDARNKKIVAKAFSSDCSVW